MLYTKKVRRKRFFLVDVSAIAGLSSPQIWRPDMEISPYLQAPTRELEQIEKLLTATVEESERECKRLRAEYSAASMIYDAAYAKLLAVRGAIARRGGG
jgi:predicted alpha/beta superfamily hydrolase